MTNIQAMAGASVGHVRACFSGRCRGFAAPVDLMRAHLRAVNRCAVRRRVASAFAGYLVTDAGPDVLPLFAKNRVWHEQGPDLYCMTSERSGWGYASQGVESGPIDAPGMIAAGSMIAGSGFDGIGSARRRWSEVMRGDDLPLSLADVEPVGVELPVWRDRAGRVVWLGGGVYAKGLRAEFGDCHTGYLLDASEFLPAGSTKQYLSAGELCAGRSDVMRAGWFE